MYYTIYKTTNKINGKFYIGKHQTKDLNDRYLGSGKLLKRAIAKYGIENFEKHILFIYDNEQDMNRKEKELVVISEQSYNLCEGGKGGFGYINKNGLGGTKGKKQSSKQKKIAQNLMLSLNSNPYFIQRRLNALRDFRKNNNHQPFLGKTHSLETKQKMSLVKKGKIPWNKGISRTKKISLSIKKYNARKSNIPT